jgi:hypothetical protein
MQPQVYTYPDTSAPIYRWKNLTLSPARSPLAWQYTAADRSGLGLSDSRHSRLRQSVTTVTSVLPAIACGASDVTQWAKCLHLHLVSFHRCAGFRSA